MTSSKDTISALIKNLIIVHQNHPPLYFLLMHFWGNIFGFSEFSIRFVSVVFGIAIVLMVYLLSKELFDQKTAILASIISALSTINIIYSQEAKQYSMLGFFVLLSTFFLIKLIKTNKHKYLYLYFISSILMFYIHHIGLIFFFIQNMILLFFYKKIFSKKEFIVGNIISWLSSLPLIIMIFWAFSTSQKDVVLLMISRGFPSFISSLGYLNILWPVLIIFLLSLYTYKKNKTSKKLFNYVKFEKNITSKSKKSFFIYFCMLFPILLYFLYEFICTIKFAHPYFITKYPFFLLPFIQIIVARIITTLFKKKYIIFLILIALFQSALLITFYSNPAKSDWKLAAEKIKSNIKENDIIVYPGGDNLAPFFYYFPKTPFDYSEISYPIYDYTSMELYDESKIRSSLSIKEGALQKMKEKVEQNKGGVWAIFYYRYQLRDYFNEFVEDAENNFKLQYEKSFDADNRLVVKYYTLK